MVVHLTGETLLILEASAEQSLGIGILEDLLEVGMGGIGEGRLEGWAGKARFDKPEVGLGVLNLVWNCG